MDVYVYFSNIIFFYDMDHILNGLTRFKSYGRLGVFESRLNIISWRKQLRALKGCNNAYRLTTILITFREGFKSLS